MVPDGNDEHSQNVFKRAQEQGRIRWPTATDGAGVPRGVEPARRLVRRLHPTTDRRRHFRRWAMAQACLDNGDIYEGIRGHHCVGCEEFKPEKDLVEGCVRSTRRSRSGSARRTGSSASRSIQQPCWITMPRIRRSSSPRCGATRSCASSRRARRPVDEPGRAVVGIRCRSTRRRRLRLVRRAHQLCGGGRLRLDPAQFARRWPANLHIVGKDITRFHCVIWPAMLMAPAAAARAGLRPRVGVLQGRAHEQVAREHVDPLDAASASALIRCGFT